MATRSFTEYHVAGKTYYGKLGERSLAYAHAQDLANSSGKPVNMHIEKGWIQEDPSGFVYDSEVTSESHKIFKPKKQSNPRGSLKPKGKWFKALAARVLPNGAVQVRVPRASVAHRNPKDALGYKNIWQLQDKDHATMWFKTRAMAIAKARSLVRRGLAGPSYLTLYNTKTGEYTDLGKTGIR